MDPEAATVPLLLRDQGDYMVQVPTWVEVSKCHCQNSAGKAGSGKGKSIAKVHGRRPGEKNKRMIMEDH
ncbi:hypothetical protein TELCIR_08126 [Teladorsagia circumcincta]|uniref:Uncharacterized protein n=1 Tax=Teladorsagia circumcincta TaxID=45464 RepID=A0A2G9UKL4_TELCI|nr:hypothetical protein TELCIR_08126 [Teladorsagia circumcincta]